jgi:hypothetical protein
MGGKADISRTWSKGRVCPKGDIASDVRATAH